MEATVVKREQTRSRLEMLGPGLLFAATSIGVSHLVQSTRAGALYGFGLLGVILLANAVKYPGFRFGPDYTAATGYTILEGYRRLGKWALYLFIFVAVVTMFSAVAALSLVTAGLMRVILKLSWTPPQIAVPVLFVTVIILMIGRYRWLERITKVLVVIMGVSTLAATLLVLPGIEWNSAGSWFVGQVDLPTILFVAALVGWMPSPMDVSIIHSLWTRAKMVEIGTSQSLSSSRFDFNLGYAGSVLFALCFLTMGVGLIYGQGLEVATGASQFAAQLLGLYEASLGLWSVPIIGVAALAVMYSSLLTASDIYPRGLSVCIARLKGPEPTDVILAGEGDVRWFRGFLIAEAVGASFIVLYLLNSFTRLIDFATTVSFLVGGIIALLNHQVIHGEEVSEEWRPGTAMRRYSQACIVLLFGFAASYLYLIFAV